MFCVAPMSRLRCVVVLTLTLLPAAAVFAVDGVIDLNQARATAGGVTPGDGPGLPITISRPGSYRLTGNLSTGSPDATFIDITADDVSLDLNGFSLGCVARPPATDCASGSGDGVRASGNNVHVMHGSIRDMGSDGVTVGAFSIVEDVRSIGNRGKGIAASAGSIVRNCLSVENGAEGITVGSNSSVVNNVSRGNGTTGIQANSASTIATNTVAENAGSGVYCNGACTISGNTVYSNSVAGVSLLGANTVVGNSLNNNTSFGLVAIGADTLYSQNTLVGNHGGGNAAQVSGGTPLGGNFCGTDTTCP